MTVMEATSLNMGVRIVNKGDTDFVGKYDNQRYRIPARGEGLVPYAAACLWLGNPATKDIDRRRRYRTDEYARLRTKYGVYDKEQLFDERVPKLEVYTLEGERVYMVADDPMGEQSNPEIKEISADNAVQAQLDNVTSTLNKVLAAIGSLSPDAQQELAENIKDVAPGVQREMEGDEPHGATIPGIDSTTTTVQTVPSAPEPEPTSDPEIPTDQPTRVKASGGRSRTTKSK